MPSRKRSILIVDADAFLAGVYARRFESGRWHVRVAESAADAEKLMAKKVPAAVIIDPETVSGGETLILRWRKDPKTESVVIVALTKLGDRSAIDRVMAFGADSYLLKGHFVPNEVREKVERLVADGRSE